MRGKNLPNVKDITRIEEAPNSAARTNIATYGNIWTNKVCLKKKGDKKGGHKHDFDHLHFLVKGRVLIEVKTDEDTILNSVEYEAPAWIKVPKEHYHSITALEDECQGYCIQALINKNGEVADTDYIGDIKGEMMKIDSI